MGMEAGGLMAALFAMLVMPNWRIFMLLSALPALCATVLVVAVPESPHYLASSGREIEAKQILENIASTNGLAEDFLNNTISLQHSMSNYGQRDLEVSGTEEPP